MSKDKDAVLITGGSDGLGRVIAEVLSSEYKVVILSDNAEKCERVAKQIGCDFAVADVTDGAAVEKAVEQVKKRYGRIDVLINSAGVWLQGDLAENSYGEIARVLDVNARGTIFMTKAVLPAMRAAGAGTIINVISQAGFDIDEFSPVYNASKWALRGFNRTMGPILRCENIRLMGFYPGMMQTEMFAKAGHPEDDPTYALKLDDVARMVKNVIELKEINVPEFSAQSMRRAHREKGGKNE
jgi:NADP-dependent 3-hydroxy acid dehydrogenase YdfG